MKKADYRIKVQAQPVALFETPVAYATVTQAEDLSRDLLAAIELRRSQTPGIRVRWMPAKRSRASAATGSSKRSR